MRGINPSTAPRATPQAELVPAPRRFAAFYIFNRPLNHFGGGRVSSADWGVFLPAIGDETKLRCDETIFGCGEDIRKPALTIQLTKQTGRQGP
jgi:hypothetical protein